MTDETMDPNADVTMPEEEGMDTPVTPEEPTTPEENPMGTPATPDAPLDTPEEPTDETPVV